MFPILLPVVAGYLLVRFRILPFSLGEGLLKFLIYCIFPSSILANLLGKTPKELFQLDLTLANFIAVLGMYAVTFILYKLLFKRSLPETAMAALTVSFISSGIVGLPIMLEIIGADNTVIPVVLNTIISLITVVPITVLLIQIGQSRDKDMKKTLTKTFLEVFKNPLVISSIIGLIFIFFSIPTPKWLIESFSKIGEATFGTALLAVGMGINISTLKSNLGAIAFLSFLRVIVFAILGVVLAYLLKLAPAQAVAFSLIMALPTAKSVPPIGQQHNVFMSESIQIVTVTTASMLILLPIIIYFVNNLWPGIIK